MFIFYLQSRSFDPCMFEYNTNKYRTTAIKKNNVLFCTQWPKQTKKQKIKAKSPETICQVKKVFRLKNRGVWKSWYDL